MTHLIRLNGPLIPGGLVFKDPRTGMSFHPMECADVLCQASKVLQHRLANPRVYPPGEVGFLDIPSIVNEISVSNCIRLNGNPLYCTDGAPPRTGEKTQQSQKVCPKCSNKLTEILCPTCSGPRITSYRCDKCGFTAQRM